MNLFTELNRCCTELFGKKEGPNGLSLPSLVHVWLFAAKFRVSRDVVDSLTHLFIFGFHRHFYEDYKIEA